MRTLKNWWCRNFGHISDNYRCPVCFNDHCERCGLPRGVWPK